jgi:transcriptional regulator with XRE-family HTH domain
MGVTVATVKALQVDVTPVRKARLIREAKGMSLGDVEKATGISPASLSRWERGERKWMMYGSMDALAALLGVSLKELMEEV